jgi:hypothetical protein
VRFQENCKTADFELKAKKEEPSFVGQKYLICIFYIHKRKFGESFSSLENSDYFRSAHFPGSGS